MGRAPFVGESDLRGMFVNPRRLAMKKAIAMVCVVMTLAGCGGMTTRERGTVVGAGVGAAAGAALTNDVGGAVAGGVVGGVIGNQVSK
jgi:osmotically inducible lipoprotein OsmB